MTEEEKIQHPFHLRREKLIDELLKMNRKIEQLNSEIDLRREDIKEITSEIKTLEYMMNWMDYEMDEETEDREQ